VPSLAWTPRTLVDRTFSLLRAYPILALPVAAADLLSFAAMHIQHALHQPLFALVFGNRESVLSSTRSAFVLTPQHAAETALLTLPLVWGSYFLAVCFYTGALLMTSALVRRSDNGDRPELRFAYVHMLKNRRRLLRFSMAMFGALIVAAIAAGVLIATIMKVPWLISVRGRDLGYLIALPLEIALVCLLTRPALKLLSERQESPSLGIQRLATSLGLITVIVQLALALLIEHSAPASLFQQKTVIGFLVREAIVSQISASTYVPLFIGLSIVADSPEQVTAFRGLEDVEGS